MDQLDLETSLTNHSTNTEEAKMDSTRNQADIDIAEEEAVNWSKEVIAKLGSANYIRGLQSNLDALAKGGLTEKRKIKLIQQNIRLHQSYAKDLEHKAKRAKRCLEANEDAIEAYLWLLGELGVWCPDREGEPDGRRATPADEDNWHEPHRNPDRREEDRSIDWELARAKPGSPTGEERRLNQGGFDGDRRKHEPYSGGSGRRKRNVGLEGRKPQNTTEADFDRATRLPVRRWDDKEDGVGSHWAEVPQAWSNYLGAHPEHHLSNSEED